MTHYDQLVSMSLEELAQWLDTHGQHDNSIWINWFSQQFCSKCDPEIITDKEAMEKLGFNFLYTNSKECSYCEVYNECRFFPNKKNPNTKEIIEMWLKENINE